jgi:hypothetical protein
VCRQVALALLLASHQREPVQAALAGKAPGRREAPSPQDRRSRPGGSGAAEALALPQVCRQAALALLKATHQHEPVQAALAALAALAKRDH